LLPRAPYQYSLNRQYQQKWSSEFFKQQLSVTAESVRLQELDWPELKKRNIKAYLRRDDELNAASGNKFYKLYYNLLNAQQLGCNNIATFGGAYSNHIYATAVAARALGLCSVGIIRGYKPKVLSPTLQDAIGQGMEIFFLGKKDYARKDIRSLLPILRGMDGEYYLIPEGGENVAGVRGCISIAHAVSKQLYNKPYTLCSAVGTGSTLAGLVAGSPNQVDCLGFSVLKGEDRLSLRVSEWLTLLGVEKERWQIKTGFHHGGYAKVTPELLEFMRVFEQRNELLLDPVYTAKMLWAIESLAKTGYWAKGSQIVALHSGGLQGRRGFGLSMV
jgi:1-aminocyclopropane-1-carboxylate deaminase